MPPSSPSGISSVRPPRKPNDLGWHRRLAAAVTDHAQLADFGLEAGRLDDQADQIADAATTPGEVTGADRL